MIKNDVLFKGFLILCLLVVSFIIFSKPSRNNPEVEVEYEAALVVKKALSEKSARNNSVAWHAMRLKTSGKEYLSELKRKELLSEAEYNTILMMIRR